MVGTWFSVKIFVLKLLHIHGAAFSEKNVTNPGDGKRDCSVLTVTVCNRSDDPIRVCGNSHFFEVSPALHFERWRAYGMRLNIADGTAVRFKPGEQRTVELVPLDGDGEVSGFSIQAPDKRKE
jgi:urease subunit beta